MTDTELELKLQCTDTTQWERIFTLPLMIQLAQNQIPQQEDLEAQYFDTTDGRLRKARLAYRIRKEGGQWLATVKGGGVSLGGLHQRNEWTVVIAEPVASIEPFLETPIGSCLQETLEGEPLHPLFITQFSRQTLQLQTPDGSIIELAADCGEIVAGGQRVPILEVELELKEGHAYAVLKLGAELAKEIPLIPEWRSKYYRGLVLAGLKTEDEHGVSDQGIKMSPEESAHETIINILTQSIQGIIGAQDTFIKHPESLDGLQQLLEKVERLYALLVFAHPLLPQEAYDPYVSTLQNWIDHLEARRNLDIAIQVWDKILRSETITLTGKPVLGEKLAERRALVHERLVKEWMSGVATPLLLEIWAWLIDRKHRIAEGMEAEISIGEYTTDHLSRWLEEIEQVGKEPDFHDPVVMESLVLRINKVYHTVETFKVLWKHKVERILERLHEVKESFDYLHDTRAIERVAAAAQKSQSTRLMFRDVGILLGWRAYKTQKVRRKLVDQWKRLRRASRIWTRDE